MIEIIGKIVLCLIVALLLGFLIGWLFAKALGREEKEKEDDVVFDELDSRLNNKLSVELAELEAKYEKEKAKVAEYSTKNRELKGELMKKISLLESTSNTLKNLQSDTVSDSEDGIGSGTYDKNEIRELKNLLAKKNRELLEFESVLIKAEKTIEELRNSKK